jgi:uncharacterized protein
MGLSLDPPSLLRRGGKNRALECCAVGALADSSGVGTRVILALMPSIEQLRAFSVNRSLWTPTTLPKALARMGFVQADPIRAPARAQDLILRHRVKGYTAGDLERSYAKLDVEEDCFVNYGFLASQHMALMHPRAFEGVLKIEKEAPELLNQVFEFVREAGPTHPKMLETHFGKLSVGNYWGGSSQATTRVLDGLHYRGHLRVARRDNGIKVYEIARLDHVLAAPMSPMDQARGLVNLILNIYAPLPVKSLNQLVNLLGYGAPHLKLEARKTVKHMVEHDLERAVIDGVPFVWPAGEKINLDVPDHLRLLAPFDPVVWDRLRFELLHGWEYRFEAYTPAPKRKMGYYALPMLWRDRVIGWANMKVVGGELETELGFVNKQPKERAFRLALEAELERMRAFLKLENARSA